MHMDKKEEGLSSFGLSLIAVASMTVDHIAAVFVTDATLYFAMRAVGRLAFMIFAFIISQSVQKSSSIKRFCMRLLIFAVISEPIFDLAFYGRLFFSWHQNIFFTLLAGVICCAAMKRGKAVSAVAVAAAVIIAELLCFDYGGAGVLLIIAFNLLGKNYATLIGAVVSASFIANGDAAFELFMIAAAPLIKLYNGKRGGLSVPLFRKWFFYLYYPTHLLIIYIFSTV